MTPCFLHSFELGVSQCTFCEKRKFFKYNEVDQTPSLKETVENLLTSTYKMAVCRQSVTPIESIKKYTHHMSDNQILLIDLGDNRKKIVN
jgi:hypothetical protein